MSKQNKITFLQFVFGALFFLIQGCSFQNDFQKSQVRFEGIAEKVDSGSFVFASEYDYVCLTYKGGGGIQRTGWVPIDKSSNSLKAEFQIPNLLGGYEYQFKLVGLDVGILGTKPLSEPCPVIRPSESGWARLGYLKTRVSVKAKSLDLTIPFAFNDGPEEGEDVLPGQPSFAAPGAPTQVIGTAGNGQVSLSWTAPSGNGSAITDHVILYSSDGGSSWANYKPFDPIVQTNVTVTGLTNGTAYVFRVAAINSIGIGLFSIRSSSVTPHANLPASPTGLGGSTGVNEVNLAWIAPDDGGSEITNYLVQYSSDTRDNWHPVPALETGSNVLSYTVTSLTGGVSYKFRVAAVNGVGPGPWSEESQSIIPEISVPPPVDPPVPPPVDPNPLETP
jgi:hypothetical protein